jgi:hypothetical protein
MAGGTVDPHIARLNQKIFSAASLECARDGDAGISRGAAPSSPGLIGHRAPGFPGQTGAQRVYLSTLFFLEGLQI